MRAADTGERFVGETDLFLLDPADRTIVATARVHGLRLVSSDRRIIDSGLVTVQE
jgi:PIN domain nuclease of toxin-antitoxin system